MHANPRCVERDQPLQGARDLMKQHDLRHLPVLDHGKLVGVLSERDLYYLESVMRVDTDVDTVREAMNPRVYTVPVGTPITSVLSEMAHQKYGCAIVMNGTEVAGIFTTTDALHLLVECFRKHPAL